MIKGCIFSAFYALICLVLAYVLYKLGVPKKITRKVVHILIGFEWFILYHFVGAGWQFLLVCLGFTLILLISHRKSLLPMISSDGDNAPGTVYYGIAMSIMALITLFVPSMILPFGIGVCCTSLGDGFAGLIGQCVNTKWNIKIYKSKSIVGTLTNFIVCFVSALLFSRVFELPLSVWHCLGISFLATQLELFTGHGLDNVTITLGTSALAFLFINLQGSGNYILPILLTPLIIVFAQEKKALTTGGIIAAVLVDIAVSLTLGNLGFSLLLAFFVGGIITDKIKKQRKKAGQNSKKKSECRNHIQVLANSLPAVVCSVIYFFTGERALLVAFVAAFCEALADTSASGVGALSPAAFDPFRMRKCKVGLSGGMSVIGTFASLVGSVIIALIALALGGINFVEAVIAAFAGFMGGIFDSFLGSLLQAKYKCAICGEVVEKREHCSSETQKISGFSFVTNDLVNLQGTLFAAVLALIIIL